MNRRFSGTKESQCQDLAERIQTIPQGTTDYCLHKVLTHQSKFISGYRTVFFHHADSVSIRFHVERQLRHECIATSMETLATHGSRRRGTGDDPAGPYRILQLCSPFTHLFSFAVDALQIARTLRPTSRRLGLSGGPQNRHQKPANVQATAKIPRIQHQGAADPTCHGADRVLVAVCVLQSRVGYLLSDTRSMHGITTGTFVLLRSFRYADNRCFFLCRSELQTDWASLLFRLDFYGLPIELEHVPGEELLRSITSMQQGTITMQQPTCQ